MKTLKLSKDLRDKIINLIVDRSADNFTEYGSRDQKEIYADIIKNGLRGYEEWTCDELFTEFEGMFGLTDEDMTDEDYDSIVLKLYEDAKFQLSIHKHFATEDCPF